MLINNNNLTNVYCLVTLVNFKLIGGGQDRLNPYNIKVLRKDINDKDYESLRN